MHWDGFREGTSDARGLVAEGRNRGRVGRVLLVGDEEEDWEGSIRNCRHFYGNWHRSQEGTPESEARVYTLVDTIRGPNGD